MHSSIMALQIREQASEYLEEALTGSGIRRNTVVTRLTHAKRVRPLSFDGGPRTVHVELHFVAAPETSRYQLGLYA